MDDKQTETTTTEETTEEEPKTWTIKRDGDRPLRFRGYLIGEGESGSGGNSGYRRDWNRGVDVAIYRIADGKGYVIRRRFWSQWQGESGSTTAVVCHTAGALLRELRDEDTDRIPPAELEALEEAAKHDDDIQTVSVEQI